MLNTKNPKQADSTVISINIGRDERAEWERAAAESGLDQISLFIKQVVRMRIKEQAAKKAQDKQPVHG